MIPIIKQSSSAKNTMLKSFSLGCCLIKIGVAMQKSTSKNTARIVLTCGLLSLMAKVSMSDIHSGEE